MKLFVDDIRDIPEGFTGCRSFDEATLQMEIHEFEYISLDYDLGYGENGLDILIWMKNTGKYCPEINIHSSHPIGRSLMRKFCLENFPDSLITMDYYG